MTRKKLRKIILAAVLCAFAVAGLSRLSFSPAGPASVSAARGTSAASGASAGTVSGAASSAASAPSASSQASVSSDVSAASSGSSGSPAAPGGSGGTAASPPATATGGGDKTPAQPAAPTCTVTIRCDTILKNMPTLKAGLKSYVPSDGVILPPTTVTFTSGETALDVLKRVTAQKNINLDWRDDPIYGGAYISEINNIPERGCGDFSGWMYKINTSFPSVSCGSCKLANGDTMSWLYTCNLGRDLY
jgi:hypothetical protein